MTVTRPDPSSFRNIVLNLITGRIILLASVIGVWELLSNHPNWYRVVSAPSDVALVLSSLFLEEAVHYDIYITLLEILVGLLIGAVAGAVTGLLLGRTSHIGPALEPALIFLYGFPQIAITPVYIFWFGIGLASKIALVAVTTYFIFAFSSLQGARSVSKGLENYFRLSGASRATTLRKLVLPTSIGSLLAALENAVPFAFLSAIFAEFIASRDGLGNIAALAGQQYAETRLWASIVIIGALGFILTRLGRAFSSRSAAFRLAG